MMRWDDTDLVATIFHELAHQVLYVKGDTAFNESFATAVADIGLERWLLSHGESARLEAYRERRELREQLVELIRAARSELEAVYASALNEAAMREKKAQRLRRLAEELRAKLDESGRDAPGWLGDELNNARLVSIGLYQLDLARFRTLYDACERDLECFYARAVELQL